MNAPDRRLNAFRPDLADARLKGRVEAKAFAQGREAVVAAPVADLRSGPSADAGLDSQLLAGDAVMVFEERGGWSWVQSARDGYVGYVPSAALAAPGAAATHLIAVPRSFVYRDADLKSPMLAAHSMGAGVSVADAAETRGTAYARLAGGGWMIADHLRPAGERSDDFVAVAERLDATPYLWGGASAFGIDCSGLVQLAMRMAGRSVPRDTDMQAGAVGAPLETGGDLSGLRRGDLVFWKGHVAIVQEEDRIIHANGRTMMVSSDPLAEAVERIDRIYGRPTGFRRP